MKIPSLGFQMLRHRPARTASALVGMSVAFFLTAAQIGVLVGWCNTTSAIVRNADADLWVMAKQTAAFDYGSPIPENRIYQVRNVPGVEWAQGLMMSWVYWRRPDGRMISIELVGLDDDLVGGPWEMAEGDVASVYDPDAVIIDGLHVVALGVGRVGDEAEILGQRARVCGLSRDVRTFTAAPFVFTSLRSAHRYEPYYRPEEITYVLARCAPGYTPQEVQAAINAQTSSVEALTRAEFVRRTILFWMLETGAGITLVLTACLGLTVGGMIGGQTLYAITQDNLKEYATLMALGFSRLKLTGVVIGQALLLGTVSVCLGSVLFVYAADRLDASPIPLETTPLIYAIIVAMYVAITGTASVLAIRVLFGVDPVTAFQH